MRLLLASLLLLGAHFSLTAGLPAEAGKASIFWPFAADSQPMLAFFGGPQCILCHVVSVAAGMGFLIALGALFDYNFPESWFVPAILLASLASLLLFALFPGPWSLLPMLIDLLLLWGVVHRRWTPATLATEV